MVFVKIPLQHRNVDVRLAAVQNWAIVKEEKKRVLAFVRDLGLGKVNAGRKLSQARQLKYLDSLKVALTNLRKPITRLAVKDIEGLDERLTKNEIHRIDGKPFADETKAEIKRFLKIYLRWALPNEPKRFIELTSWLDTKTRKLKTPEFLTEAEVGQLYEACRDAQSRLIVALLFDTGARAEEFFNIRLEDVEKPSGDRNYYRIHLKEEYSKTKGRVVSLFWDRSTLALNEFLPGRISTGTKPGDRLYPGTYDAMRFFLKRLGRKILERRVYPHLLRHSSATFYAAKFNRQQLCKRYGWTFSSDMPDVYINRAGIDEAEIEVKFTQTELGAMKTRMETQEGERKMLLERLGESERRQAATENQIKESQVISAILKGDPALRDQFRRAALEFLEKNRGEFTGRQRARARQRASAS